MAGFYPDVPGPRMAWDTDGSIAAELNAAATAINGVLSPADCSTLNDESTAEIAPAGSDSSSLTWFSIMFPEPRDIVGVLTSHRNGRGNENGTVTVEVSSDTTNHLDGVWAEAVGSPTSNVGPRISNRGGLFRTGIRSVSGSNVVGVRFGLRQSDNASDRLLRIQAIHIYGSMTNPAVDSQDQLRLWHPTLDEEIVDGAWFDWGDVPRGIPGIDETRQFRVKNESATLTANTVSLGTEILTDGTVTVPPQFTFDVVGGTGYANPNTEITSLGPGVISPVVTVKRVTPVNADLALFWPRIAVSVASWS